MTYQPRDLPRPRRRRNCALCGLPGHIRTQCAQYDPLRAPGNGRSGGEADRSPDEMPALPVRPTEADRLSIGFHMLDENYGA